MSIDPISVRHERKKLRQMAADHAAYEIAHGLRELLDGGVDQNKRGAAERLRGGICEALLFLGERGVE